MLYMLGKRDLIFHVENGIWHCMQIVCIRNVKSRILWNVKICFLGKLWKNISHCRPLILLPKMPSINSFSAKFQTTFVVCFSILTHHRLERRLYVKLKDRMSKSVDPDETAHWAVSSILCCLQRSIIIVCGSERVKEVGKGHDPGNTT